MMGHPVASPPSQNWLGHPATRRNLMTRCTIALMVFACFLITGCGRQKHTVTRTPGNKVSVAGVTVEIRPGGEEIGTMRPVGEGDYYVISGDVMVSIDDEMRLSVSMDPKRSDEFFKHYGSIVKGDSILIDDRAVMVNGENRTPINEL
jgi:hypothetical protein